MRFVATLQFLLWLCSGALAGLCNRSEQPNCQDCDRSEKFCLQCKPGYFTNILKGTCLACTSGCEKCNEELLCQECYSGFTIQQSKCEKCLQNCRTCGPAPTDCLTCYFMYELRNGACTLKKEYVIGGVLAAAFCMILVMLYVCLRKKNRNGSRYTNVLDDDELAGESRTGGFSSKTKSLKYDQNSDSISEVHINPKQSMHSEQGEVETIVQNMSVKGSVYTKGSVFLPGSTTNNMASVISFKSHKV